jgi:hypothetical protein
LGKDVAGTSSPKQAKRLYLCNDDPDLECYVQILDDVFASEMQKHLGNSLQDRDLDPPQSVVDARSILC